MEKASWSLLCERILHVTVKDRNLDVRSSKKIALSSNMNLLFFLIKAVELLREMLNTLSFALYVASAIWPSHQQWQKEKKERERENKKKLKSKRKEDWVHRPFFTDIM